MSTRNAAGPTKSRILVLGGTGEALALASELIAKGHNVTTALAGRTRNPALSAGLVRIGGFGGAAGLASYLTEEAVDILLDATHPFAHVMSAHAVAAARRTGTPLLRLTRPPWPSRPGWIGAATLTDAADILPAGAMVFLSVGRQGLDPFYTRNDCTFVCRLIETRADIPGNWTVIQAKGPFTLAEETALFAHHRITHLVSKNSGAQAVAAKLDAADAARITVVMVQRPALAAAPEVATVAEAIAWIAVQTGSPKPRGSKLEGT